VIRVPRQCLVVLVGPSGSGKTQWAAEHFPSGAIVSSDRMRALVGESEHDQRAGTDAFVVLDLVLDRRMKRKLLTVLDTLGLDAERRRKYVAAARKHGVPVMAVVFDTPAAECRRRNTTRTRPVPAKVLSAQLKQWPAVRAALADDGFDAVHQAAPVRVVDPQFVTAPAAAGRQQEDPLALEFGLHIPRFTWDGGPAELRGRLAATVRAAEDAGFRSLWVMDHFIQIPVAGREWDEMLDSYTTLGFIAAHTERATVGALVTGVTYRNIAHLGKIVATLDVLSGGRAVCGLGAAWFEREHRAYGWEFPPLRDRYALLEDALQMLPMMWGPGSPSFEGRAITVPEAMCYPRPLQEKIPILVGGSGEKRTLRLVAQYADACNLFGDADTVRHKVDVLHRHCADVDRDPSQVTVTHFAPVLVTDDAARADGRVVAGPVDDHVGRFRELTEAGVDAAFVSLVDGGDPVAAIDRFAPVIAAFSP
jgi:F420-dependent oxidoreductase-like protein